MKSRKPRLLWQVVPIAFALAAAGTATGVYAATAAGTQIKNLATVSYEDAAGNQFSAQSNEAVVTVAQVYSATIGTDSTVTASPGQPVYLPFVLENTGNGSDNFSLTASDDTSVVDDLNADSIRIYDDSNGNGQADSGELEISSLSLAAGAIRSIVVEVQVPPTAIADETIGVTLTAEAEEGTGSVVAGSVTDVTTSQGLDGFNGTVESIITVTADAVVVATKSSALDVINSEITYTIQLMNNGNAPAATVAINDAFPENTSYVNASAIASGLLASNGDTLPAVVTLDETVDGVDYNGDGDTLDTGLSGLSASDLELPPNSTVSLAYTVSYDPLVIGGGTVIANTAFVFPDVNGDGAVDSPVPTNLVYDIIVSTYGVAIADTAEDTGGDQINDGQDDDEANQIQLVDEVAAGATVAFKNVITNTGNVADILELSIVNSSGSPFPTGTVFTFWDSTGLVQLTDSNGISGVDAGTIAAGASETITIKAALPPSISGPGNYDAFITVTSAGKPDQSASMTERLSLITQPTVDIHNARGGLLGIDEDPLGTPDYSAVNTITANIGDTVTIPLFIDNDSDASVSYQLGVGGSYDDATNTLGSLPAGWVVEYFLSDGTGPTGSPVTSTPAIPGNTEDFEIFAVVTVPSDQTQALFDFSSDNDADAVDENLDGNGDGDGDYPLFFEVSSTGTGANDVTVEAIDVNTVHAVTLTPSGSSQIESGGTVVFPHTLANNGNADATLELTATNSLPGWTNTVLIDTVGNGVPDTELGNLTAGTITVQQPDGTDVTLTVTVAGGVPGLTVPPGANIPLSATVFAPSSASDGDVDTLTISATDSSAGTTAIAQDQSQIVAGQVRITKTVAVDTDCDNDADSTFAETQTTLVEPDQCVIWQIVAENQGTADAYKVLVTDAIPPFSTFEAGSLRYCITSACTPGIVTDGTGDDAGEESAGNISFYVGADATPATGVGGTLVSGDQATVRFTVRVD